MDSEKLFEGFGSTGAGNTNFGESGEFSGSSPTLISKFTKETDNINDLFRWPYIEARNNRKRTVLNR